MAAYGACDRCAGARHDAVGELGPRGRGSRVNAVRRFARTTYTSNLQIKRRSISPVMLLGRQTRGRPVRFGRPSVERLAVDVEGSGRIRETRWRGELAAPRGLSGVPFSFE